MLRPCFVREATISTLERRLARERNTIQVMLELYCHGHHLGGEVLCAELGPYGLNLPF